MTDKKPKIFISHSWEDNDFAKNISDVLKNKGAGIWIDLAAMSGGDNLIDEIGKALEWCDTFVLIWSEAALNSKYVKREWTSALISEKRIIPCIIDNSSLPAILRGIYHINFKDFNLGCQKLLQSLDLIKNTYYKYIDTNSEKKQIFLSYAREDIGYAKKLYNDLKKYNLNVWFDNEELLPGDKWEAEILKAIQKSMCFLILLSSHSITKIGYVEKELNIVLEAIDKKTDTKINILPVRLEICEPKHEKLTSFQWIDLFPESNYTKGLSKILKVLKPGTYNLRNTPSELSIQQFYEMLKDHNFFESRRFADGSGLFNQFRIEHIENEKLIIDENTGLVWQNNGSGEIKNFNQAKIWIAEINKTTYCSFNDWRLPTLEEAMSLLEPEKGNRHLHISPLFDQDISWTWTCDLLKGSERVWIVRFNTGDCFHIPFHNKIYAKAVRSKK